jgi:HK97 family phage major capsid protein
MEKVEQLKSLINENLKNEVAEQLTEKSSAIENRLDEIEIKLQKSTENKMEEKSFSSAFGELIAKNFDSIREVSLGNKVKLNLKAVGTMTVSNNLTGDAVRTYQPGVAMVPNRKINFRDLIPAVASATGIYTLYRETGVEGSISVQSTPGDAKTQIDYDLTAVTYTARYIAGFARIDKSMLQDLPFLQSALPQMLLRDFYKAEDLKFYTDLSGAATGSTTTSATVDAEQIIDYVANLESADFTPNGIVVNPKQWARLVTTKPADYSVPGGFTITADGNIAIAGIPVYKSSFIADDKVLVGDWNYAKRVVVDDLKVEFFEQDSDNVQKNLVTCRIEAREVLAIDRLDAFVFADLGNVA